MRLARAFVAASVATGVALGSHVAGGGSAPGPAGVAVPLALSFAVCVQLAGRAASGWRIALGVAVSQALFHVLFVMGGGTVTMDAGAHAHHLAAGSLTVADASHAAHGGAPMTLAHVVAAIVTTAALWRLDAALASAGRAIGHLLSRLATPISLTAPHAPRRAASPASPAGDPLPLVLASGLGLRGPPLR
ncbi:hypothetical protein [Demequina litorisediminis]|nr:hypothetical protein [Demequina litorisediminis]